MNRFLKWSDFGWATGMGMVSVLALTILDVLLFRDNGQFATGMVAGTIATSLSTFLLGRAARQEQESVANKGVVN